MLAFKDVAAEEDNISKASFQYLLQGTSRSI
jgi:hypothetical protein